eukprot:CAMPEP_0176453196 /NCGR_PEP_ID=MMETSP0127-20121128/29076_1 /TAXON_ID=938130 /ORGANISM="Platyophrya macrostoma, Strain WH" /LENGTH=30 /DNA_ID= /DNA_START= /DNA_END= /DNA_ORIENTATION=
MDVFKCIHTRDGGVDLTPTVVGQQQSVNAT